MKVCILGNGLASLAIAKSLINQGIKIDLISRNFKSFYDKSQTLGISQSNIDFFNKNILNINNLLWGINKIEIFSENFNKEKILNFEKKNNLLFSTVKNYKLYNYLLSELKKNTLFSVKNKNYSLSSKNYNLVINLDPQHIISKKFFYKKFTKNYDSFAHVTIVEHQKIPSNNIASQIFTKQGPIAFLPISSTETSIVYSARGRKSLEKKKLEKLIRKNLAKCKIKKIKNVKSFELKSHNIRTYYHENILAFGDLLHRLHPLAGQGFNMTLRDIKVLLEIINSKMNLGIQIDSSTCIEFNQKTKSRNYLFSNSIDFIYEFFNFESKTKTNLMSKSVQFLGKNKLVNKFFTKLADNGMII